MNRDTDPNDTDAPPIRRGPRDLGREIDDVASQLRVFKTDTRHSLNAGANAMAEIRGAISKANEALEEVNAKKPVNWVSWGGFALSVAALIFQAGRYPDRPEYNNDRAVQEATLKALKAESDSLEKQLIQTRGIIERLQDKLDEVQKASKLEQKVDALGRKR